MNSTARSCLALITLSSFFAFAACSDDDDDVGNGAGAAAGAGSEPTSGGSGSHVGGGAGGSEHGGLTLECRVLGELCHAADTDDGSDSARDCHELGHVGNSSVCAAQFGDCIQTCTETPVGAGGGGGGDAHCVALGSLCHAAGEIDAEAQACHELGHEGNAVNCASGFDECATLCLAVLAEIEEPGAGGAGGAPSAAAGAGGAAGSGGAS